MRVRASTVFNMDSDSEAAGISAAQGVVEELGADELSMLLVYGTRAKVAELEAKTRGRKPWSMLGFECRGRTVPFLDTAAVVAENAELGARVGPTTPWLGTLAWGEIAHLGGEPAFHNYTYPLAVLMER